MGWLYAEPPVMPCPEDVPGAATGLPVYLLPLSARTPGALQTLAASFAAHLRAHPQLAAAELCWSAGD